MAGTVGHGCAEMPGYGGYIPGCQQPILPVHTRITERVPLAQRHHRSQNGPAPLLPPLSPEDSPMATSLTASPTMTATLGPSDSLLLPKRTANGPSVYMSDYKPPPPGAGAAGSPALTRHNPLQKRQRAGLS
eukprot:RCo020745